ncbi:MAG TPA: AraC family transcriptional regulator [Candidatus Acidoferrum sp.]|nr:AraC family transcriptional regulator [Candidatus Acidoferrum sp.]
MIPRRGAFVVHHRGERSVVDANHVLFFTARQPHRVSHLDLAGDACTVFRFDQSVLDEAIGEHGPTSPAAAFPRLRAVADDAASFASRRLFVALTAGEADNLAVEEASLRVLQSALRSAGARSARAGRDHRIARVTQECLAERPFERWSLGTLAAAARASPYHLARSFRATIGLPIHQYQLRLRLAAGLERLLEGCDDITALALDLGFSSHSHFTAAFRRAYGQTPSAIRARLVRDGLARLRKISTAAPRALA